MSNESYDKSYRLPEYSQKMTRKLVHDKPMLLAAYVSRDSTKVLGKIISLPM